MAVLYPNSAAVRLGFLFGLIISAIIAQIYLYSGLPSKQSTISHAQRDTRVSMYSVYETSEFSP